MQEPPLSPDDVPDEFQDPVELPITDELDLHHFRPKDIKTLVPDYLEACRERGILNVRVVHGKGVGHLRRSVHAILDRLPFVVSYSLAHEFMGGWGATVVQLAPPTVPTATKDETPKAEPPRPGQPPADPPDTTRPDPP